MRTEYKQQAQAYTPTSLGGVSAHDRKGQLSKLPGLKTFDPRALV